MAFLTDLSCHTPFRLKEPLSARSLARSSEVLSSTFLTKPFPSKRFKICPNVTFRVPLPCRNRVFASLSPNGGWRSVEVNESNDDYVESFVIDAVRMRCQKGRHGHSDEVYMTLANGSEQAVTHVNPMAGPLLFQSSTPIMILRMIQNHNLMLPIVVSESAVSLLMKALRGEAPTRPNCYDLMGDMIRSLDYKISMVKITERVVNTYYAKVYLSQHGRRGPTLSFDSRPSDAINLAVRWNVPIFVHRSVFWCDSIQLAHAAAEDIAAPSSSLVQANFGLWTAIQGPESSAEPGHDYMAEEIVLLKDMMAAVEEERYKDAAQLRDQLDVLRQQNRVW